MADKQINWDEIEEKYAFKDYAPDGKYNTKIKDIEVHEVGTNGSVAIDFTFEDSGEYQMPKATHWLTFKEGKDNWRIHHTKELLVVSGIAETAARSAVAACESKSGKEQMVAAYAATFKKAAAKHGAVEIEVYTERNQSNGRDYARAEFTSSKVAMPHESAQPATADVLPEAEDVPEDADAINLEDIPFN